MEPRSPHPRQLEYAPPPAWHRTRRFRVVLALVIVAAVAWSAHRWGPRALERANLLTLQRRCMNHIWPADATAFQQDASVSFATQPWKLRPTYSIPQPWTNYYNQYFRDRNPADNRRLKQSHGTLFLHRRVSPAGNERIVAVELAVSWFPEATLLQADKRLVRPATLTSDPVEVWGGTHAGDMDHPNLIGARQTLMMIDYGKDVRLQHGRPDPNDQTHFTIDCLIDGTTVTIDGWLRDDDTVKLTVRQPPR